MLTLPHTVTGATIGSLVSDGPGNLAVAFSLGVASHYLLDKVPHWENMFGKYIHGFPGDTPASKLPKISILSGVVDGVIAVIVFWLVFRQVGEGSVISSPLFWGAIGGFLPDVIDNIPIVRNFTIKIPGVKHERSFHENFHISDEARRRFPYLTGLITQLVVVTLGLYILLK